MPPYYANITFYGIKETIFLLPSYLTLSLYRDNQAQIRQFLLIVTSFYLLTCYYKAL